MPQHKKVRRLAHDPSHFSFAPSTASGQDGLKRAVVISSQAALTSRIQQSVTGYQDTMPYTVDVIESGVAGLESVYKHPPQLVIIDAALSDMSGHALSRILKHDPVLRQIPVILVTHHNQADYVRMSELSLIADIFVDSQTLENDLPNTLTMLSHVFSGIQSDETEQIWLAQQSAAQVHAVSRLVQLLDQSATERDVMHRFRQVSDMISSRGVLSHMLFSIIDHVLDYDLAGVFFNDQSREARHFSFHVKHGTTISQDTLAKWTKKFFDELSQLSHDKHLFDATSFELINTEFPADVQETHPKSHALYPCYSGQELVGALVLVNKRAVHYEGIFPFKLILNELSNVMRLRRYYTQAQYYAVSDPLTKLYSYPHFSHLLDREIKAARRHKSPMSMAHISIDEFQAINTQYGHEMGDQALKHMADLCRETLRGVDIIARASGRRILALLPSTSPDKAVVAMKRLQKCLQKQPLLWRDSPLPLTISVGIVSLESDIANGSEFITLAQTALDKAREKGPSHIVVISSE